MNNCVRLLACLSIFATTACTRTLTTVAGSSFGQPEESESPVASKRLKEFAPIARDRLTPYFSRVGIEYPPAKISMVALKQEKRLELYASDGTSEPRFIRSFRILAASGNIGPKLREGDLQVPEGIYQIDSLNPNSRFHVSMRVSYPNDFDRQHAELDGRRRLGGDIMIHGDAVSAGCLAVGDVGAEDLFVLAADVGVKNIQVIVSPVDLRLKPTPATEIQDQPAWVPELYESIKAELSGFRRL